MLPMFDSGRWLLFAVLCAGCAAQSPLPSLPAQFEALAPPAAGLRIEVVDALTGKSLDAAGFRWTGAVPAGDGGYALPRGVHWYEASVDGYLTRRDSYSATTAQPVGVLRIPLLPRVLAIRGSLSPAVGCRVAVPKALALSPLCPHEVLAEGGRFEAFVRESDAQALELTIDVMGRAVNLSVPLGPRRSVDRLPHKGVPTVDVKLTLPLTERERRVFAFLNRRRQAPLDPAWRASADAALRWLACHQDADGRWNADDFMAHDKGRELCTGPGSALNDVGLTGLAVLAFLAAGHAPFEFDAGELGKPGARYGGRVRKAVEWLIQQRITDNEIVAPDRNVIAAEHFHQHCIATIALCEATAAGGDEAWLPLIQGAVTYLELHRKPYGVWGYRKQDGGSMMATIWATLALFAAQDAGFTVEATAFDFAIAYVDELTDVNGRTGYMEKGGLSMRHVGAHHVDFPVDRNEAMTAAAVFLRRRFGQDRLKTPLLESSIQLVGRKPPVRHKDARGSSVDFIAWSLGTHAMSMVGGKEWPAWSKAMTEAVVKRQRKDGSFAGSWDPEDAWGHEGGRVYATAILAWALLAPFRSQG
jgi:hypothetical protein